MADPDDIRSVLAHYPAFLSRLTWTRLGTAGGFSGAVLWRGDILGQPAFALKAWPTGYPRDSLESIHRLMIDARTRCGLGFIPTVLFTTVDRTNVLHAGRVWDLTSWMPGTADYHFNPSKTRLISAMQSVSSIHLAWKPAQARMAPCPGVLRRLHVLGDYPTLAARVSATPVSVPGELVQRAMTRLPDAVATSTSMMLHWSSIPVPLQPCLCDIWHDHVLFTGDRVTGVIDYGSVKWDNPAVDLARLLGDLVGDDDEQFHFGLIVYRDVSGLQPVSAALARALDLTGVVCGILRWIRDLTSGFADAPSPSIVRFKRLLERMESPVFGLWNPELSSSVTSGINDV